MDNREQVEFWNGPASARWIHFQEGLDRALEPFGRAAIDALPLQAGQRVLDVGCGCGHTSLLLAQRVGPNGFVCGLDVSAPMLNHAQQRAAGQPNLEFVLGDAAERQFEPRFDHVFSRFGVMFFAQPSRAFGNLRTALVEGGRLAFVCWRELVRNPWGALPLGWVRGALPGHPEDPPSAGPGPFAFADAEHVTRVLEEAGFHDIEVRALEAPVVFATDGLDPAVEFASAAGPAARLMQAASDDDRARVRAVLRVKLRPYLEGRTVTLSGSAWLVTAAA